MVSSSQQFTLKLIFDAGVAFMGLISGALKEIAPPEMPKIWVILATITASVAFFTSKLLLGLTGVQPSRNVWLGTSIGFAWSAIICGIVYVLTRFSRTITYEGTTKLAGSTYEYRHDVSSDPQNEGKTRDDLLRDAAGVVEDVWTAEAINKSRRILGIEYTIFIALLSLGLYLGIEAYNTPPPDPTFAEKVAKLKDVHFELDKTYLSPDAINILNADGDVLKDVFKQFSKSAVVLEGYCDDRGTDAYNFVLGYKRAEVVRQALIANHVDKERLAVSSHGRKESTCQSNDDACRQKDRRVHLLVIQN
jgi:outer membrane protein OmpA-like peptidoglycan-associated protein